ncbi:MAG: hypothetical protein HC836_05155 [Richelia sp. RM2_1_2]|nr:hypothetical protein [Richelia sp. SM2_1_7]NJM17610.1 hypothetical protein [Richelia sp. SM1_7_0]NJN09905.1 hypothetical protein [Richelia sp. RM1_1_1]NJO26574.1 hypothetical protein [Richelia sp. SL_2_1]NJO57767.1 hypothetical protein [Richelia sp. RM2_1_2]
MNSEESNKLSASKRFARFAIGLFAGLFVAGIFWLYSIEFHVSIPLVQGIIGSLILAISCGIIATISGLDKIFENFPNL